MFLHIFSWHFSFLFFIKKIVFLSFSLFFLMKYLIFTKDYLPIRNQNRWSAVVSGTVCVIVLWLTSDEWVYHLFSYPKFYLGQVVQIQLMGSAGLWNQASYKASGNLLVELQPQTKYLRKTPVFMWNSALWEKFNFYFQGVFC